MEKDYLTIIKLGGSTVTLKNKPLSANLPVIMELGKIIKQITTPLIIVHGGGSFGHHFASKWGLSTSPQNANPQAIVETRKSMFDLHLLILESFSKSNVFPYTVPPCSILDGDQLSPFTIKFLNVLMKNNLIPITFGDVIVDQSGAYIISGDKLMEIISSSLPVKKAIFAMDVDGIYENTSSGKSLADTVNTETVLYGLNSNVNDVTGSISGKLNSSFKIAKNGIDVHFVNGAYPDRILKVLKGRSYLGSMIKGDE